MKLNEDIIHFFCNQGYVIVSTFDPNGHIHCSAKGIVGIEANKLYVFDLFKNKTYRNLKKNSRLSITAVDENQFKGYTLQGQAKIVPHKEIDNDLMKKWEDKIVRRISDRMIKGVKKGVKSVKHHEAHLPTIPKYLIVVDVEQIIDLSSPSRKKRS